MVSPCFLLLFLGEGRAAWFHSIRRPAAVALAAAAGTRRRTTCHAAWGGGMNITARTALHA